MGIRIPVNGSPLRWIPQNSEFMMVVSDLDLPAVISLLDTYNDIGISYEVEMAVAPSSVQLTDGTNFYTALTNTQLRAAPVPVTFSGGGFGGTVDQGLPNSDPNAWPVKDGPVLDQLKTLNSLIPSLYDYISLGYTGSDLTNVIFKQGGSSGTTISTLTLAYDVPGGNLVSVTKT